MSASQNGSPKTGNDNLTNTVTKIEANWNLRRLQAKYTAEFDFLRRETVQLCQKNFIKPSIESIDLTEEELRFVKDSKETKLREIVTKSCGSTIKHLMNQKVLSFPFNEPVNTDLYQDYLNYVQTPMDFGTIKNKIEQYKHPKEFEKDVRLVFENAKKYNAPETEVREMARVLEQKFEEKWNKSVLPKLEELKTFEADEHLELKQCKADSVIREAESRVHECCKLLLERLQTLHEEIVFTQCLASSQCGYVDKELRLRLGWELATLPPEHFQRAANLLITRHPGLVATMKKNTIDLDISKIDSLTFWQLKDFVNQCTKDGVYDDKSENSTDAEEQERKRQKRTKLLKEQVVTSDSLSTSRQEVQWPQVPFGVGLKPYDAEIEPFIPLRVDDQSLPFSRFFNSRREASTEDPNKGPVSGSKRKIEATQLGLSGGPVLDGTNPTKARKETSSSLFNTIPTTISELRPPTVVVSKGDVSTTTTPAQSLTFSTFFAANLNSVGGQSIFTTPQTTTSVPPPACTAPTPMKSSEQETPNPKE